MQLKVRLKTRVIDLSGIGGSWGEGYIALQDTNARRENGRLLSKDPPMELMVHLTSRCIVESRF